MKQKNYTKFLFLLCLLVLGIGNIAKGQLLTEQFEYGGTDGGLTALSGGNWIEQGGPVTPVVGYNSASVTFGTYPSSGGKATFGTSGQDIYRQYTDVTAGVVYAGFIVKVNSTQAAGDYFAHFSNNGTSFHTRLFARTKGAGYELGVAKGGSGGTTAVYNASSTTLTLGTSYFVVLKYDFGSDGTNLAGDIATIYVFDVSVPTTEPGTFEAQATAGTGTLSELRRIAIRQGGAANAPAGEIDYIRVGTTWSEVTSGPATATLNVNPNSLSGFTTIVGTASSEQSYTLSGTDLTGFPDNIVVTAPTGYEVSLTSGSGFAGSVNVAYASATLSNTTIFVRIASSASVGSPSGNITNAGGGATTQNVAVSGTVNPLTPTLNVNPNSLSGFTTIVGTASSEQSYTLSGTNLTGFPDNIVVTAPTGYEVSLTSGSGFAGSVNVAYASATLSNTTIFVRIASSASVGSPSGNITNAGGGATTQNVAVSGTVNPVPSPALNVNPTSLSGFTTTAGTASANQSYTLSGANLTGFPSNIVVTAPTGYEVSLTSGSGYASSINVAYTSATLSSTTIFVRIAASASAGSPSGDVTNAGGGATTQNVAVSGTVNPAPSLVPIADIRNAIDGTSAQVAPYAPTTDVIIRGQIYGVNRLKDANAANGTKQDFEFTVIDNSTGRNGVVIRLSGSVDIAPIDLQEGDDVTVTGKVSQFNGLTQIGTITSVVRNSTGNARKTPIVATLMSENEESQLIRFNNVTVVDKSQWNFTTGVTGSTPNRAKNVDIQVGANTYQLRITEQSELWNTTYASVFGATEPTTGISMIGLGGQFDSSSPFDSGYQFFVTKIADIIAPVPLIPAISTNVAAAGLDFGSLAKNEVSTSQSYKLIGKDLPTTGSNLNVVVTVPNNFQVSKNNTDFSGTISFTNAEINNAGTTGLDVYVRFVPTSEIDGAKGGDVMHSVPALTPTLTTTVAVKGTQTAPLSIEDELASQVNVYPNPSRGNNIKIDAPQEFSVEMLDVTGRKVASFNSSAPKSIDNLPNGLYFLQFSNGTTKFVKRLVIQK